MPDPDITLQVNGLAETEAKLTQVATDLGGQPMLQAVREAAVLVTAEAKRLAPADTGRLRSTITPTVYGSGTKIVGAVGTTVKYAPYMEVGTGTFAGRAPHFPPPAALNTWARRHGLPSGFIVARAIFRAGGLKPRRFLQQAFEKNAEAVKQLIGDAVIKIVGK